MRGFNIHMSTKSNTFCIDSDRAKNKFMRGPSMSL